jgi:hypothetical protein
MSTQVVVFLRPDGGNGFGHVGWGFAIPGSTEWFVGSMENPSGWAVNLPGWTGFWHLKVPNGKAAQEVMRRPEAHGAPKGTPPYASAKVLAAPAPNLRAAQQKMNEWAHRPYTALGGNCMNCVFDILTAYGAALPDPTINPCEWSPNNWFNDIHAQVQPA